MHRSIPLAFAALALPLPVLAQSPQTISPPRYGVAASHDRAPAAGRLVIGYASNDPGRWITEFWSMSSQPTVVFARTALDAWEGQEQIRWADSRTCPGLIAILLEANALSVPGLIVPLDEGSRARARQVPPPAPPALDGPGPGAWVFWAIGSGGSALDVQFSAYGGPWVDWGRRLRTALHSCWAADQPAGPIQN